MWIPYGPVHQSAHDTNHGASGTRPCHACGQILRPNAPAASRASTAVPQRNKLTPNEIHAKEEEHAKETIGLAKDIKHGMSAASVRKKYNVSDSDIISRLATVTKQLHEILDVKGLDTETQTLMMAHNHRGAGLAMPQAVERSHREQDVQGELMRFEQYGIEPDKAKMFPRSGRRC